MKRLFVVGVTILVCSSIAFSSSSSNRKWGFGVVLGAPSGFSLKYWESSRVAYQGSIGGMWGGGLMIGADYLVHENALRNPSVPFYYGPGIFIGDAGFGGPTYSRGKLALGIRGAFGVDYLARDHPFDISFELGPALLLTPVLGMGIEVSIAVRFYP
ncbi:MAG: hypothetical protein FJ217_16285 [Ignavibacteria bacterium]|nr:hypothetical protein [Ignavibacteria bacterium]